MIRVLKHFWASYFSSRVVSFGCNLAKEWSSICSGAMISIIWKNRSDQTTRILWSTDSNRSLLKVFIARITLWKRTLQGQELQNEWITSKTLDHILWILTLTQMSSIPKRIVLTFTQDDLTIHYNFLHHLLLYRTLRQSIIGTQNLKTANEVFQSQWDLLNK